MTAALADHVNRILDRFRRFEMGVEVDSPFAGGLVIASAFAFVELCRKWEPMVDGRFSPIQLQGFLKDLPNWFSIAPVDETLLPYYANIPPRVFIRGEEKAIEWCDAIHAATADSRGRRCLLATTDGRLHAITHLRERILI